MDTWTLKANFCCQSSRRDTFQRSEKTQLERFLVFLFEVLSYMFIAYIPKKVGSSASKEDLAGKTPTKRSRLEANRHLRNGEEFSLAQWRT